MAEVINPRVDGPRVMKQLYDALKHMPCRCPWEWRNGNYGPVSECEAHKALAAYEAITEATR